MDYPQRYVHEVSEILKNLPWERINEALELLHAARLRRATVFLCGNGGSSATSSHFVNDLNKGANAPDVPRFRAIGLSDNVPLLTAWSNDSDYAESFVQPLRNLGRPGDVLIAISGSGNSPNVINAVQYAREIGIQSIGFAGRDGGRLAPLVDVPIIVPTQSMEQIEDVHMIFDHLLVSALRKRAEEELVPSLLLPDGYSGTAARASLPLGKPRPSLAPRAAIFLDRDGVINANRSDYVKSWEEVELLPGAVEALQKLARTGMPIVVVTNQAAVSRHLLSFEVAEHINRRLVSFAAANGARIDAVVWCPHRPEKGCDCRKPKPGLLTYAAEVLNLDLSRSYLIGDARSDIAAGQTVGCTTALVLTGRGSNERAQVEAEWGPACQVLPDISAAADWIVRSQTPERQRDANETQTF
jgi:D-sedoheptulose 7-phosphate isomerase